MGIYAYPLAMAFTPSGDIAAVVGTYAGRVILVNTRTRRVTAKITVGRYPLTAAIAR